MSKSPNEESKQAVNEANSLIDRQSPGWKQRAAEMEQDALDAARYRWLRDKANHAHGGSAPMVFNCDITDTMDWTLSRHGAELDTAIDIAMERWPIFT